MRRRLVSQGTISVLFGCHSIVHSYLVALAWKHLYRRWPKPWETICIFLHDVGHIGLDYLDNEKQKNRHWELGARIAKILFGTRGYSLVAGHCKHSGIQQSLMYKADKYSWRLAPYWWLYLNTWAEPLLCIGYSREDAIADFRQQVNRSIESGEFVETHSFFLDRLDRQNNTGE
jgi:hypothetical protein